MQTAKNTDETKYFEVNLGHKVVHVRKWKAKDRKAFKKLVKADKEIGLALMDTLVKSCIQEKNIVLSFNELQYLFVKIRALSLGEFVDFSWKCSCGNENTEKIDINSVNRFSFKPWNTIKTENVTIELQDAPNVDFYNKKIKSDDYDDTWELAFRVKSINENISLSFDEVVNFIDDLDIDEADEVFEQFCEMEFNIDNTKDLTCKSCSKVTTFEFDEIPEFFPSTWFEK